MTFPPPWTFFSFFCLLSFLGLHQRHMEVPRLWVQSELLLTAYARTTATPDPNQVCDLHHSSQQRLIPNSLREARDRTCNLMVPRWIHFRCATMGTPFFCCGFLFCFLGLGLFLFLELTFKEGKFGTFILMSPLLIFLGVSADPAQARAPVLDFSCLKHLSVLFP